ncbi:MAG: arsenite methyltransferase [Gemmatimonadota bacterium]|nr:arsenite methyltransferase [Gemmatimonadota bacterium]
MSTSDLKETVRDKYGAAARQAAAGAGASCCGPTGGDGGSSCCGTGNGDPITSDLYSALEKDGLPDGAVLASLGCGNPTALAELRAGETVLDLGSGGGIDVLLSARRVGPTGKAYGLDMTPDMLALARHNQQQAGVENAEFLEGEIEAIPLPDDSVDVIISNCVINLSVDKPTALAEAFRVLRPEGRFAVSDIVVRGEVDPAIRENVELWIGCVAGALEESEYVRLLGEAGFVDIEIEPTRIYGADDAEALVADLGGESYEIARRAAGAFMSAFVRARKPS